MKRLYKSSSVKSATNTSGLIAKPDILYREDTILAGDSSEYDEDTPDVLDADSQMQDVPEDDVESCEVLSASEDYDPTYRERYLHSLVGDIQLGLEDAGIHNTMFDHDHNNLFIAVPSDEDDDAVEYEVPFENLSFTFDRIIEDAETIITEIIKDSIECSVSAASLPGEDDDNAITEAEHDEIANTIWDILDHARNVLDSKYDLQDIAEYESREVGRKGNKYTCTLWLCHLTHDYTIDVCWTKDNGSLILDKSVEDYGQEIVDIYLEEYGASIEDLDRVNSNSSLNETISSEYLLKCIQNLKSQVSEDNDEPYSENYKEFVTKIAEMVEIYDIAYRNIGKTIQDEVRRLESAGQSASSILGYLEDNVILWMSQVSGSAEDVDTDNLETVQGAVFEFGAEEAEKFGELIQDNLSGMTISKRIDLGELPGGLVYEADKLGIDMWDLLKALEGMCRDGRAQEIDDSTYLIK